MKFGALVCVAAALLPAALANVDITFTAEKFNRRDADDDRNPSFGVFLANEYLKRGGAGLPAPKDVRETNPKCQWKSYDKVWGWIDDYNVQCYLSPSYKYHAYSYAKPFTAWKSIKAGACADTAATKDYPVDHIPKYTIGVPYLYMSNWYDRRCKVRAMVKVPKTDEHDEYWVLAWVQDHARGYWDSKGVDDPKLPQQGILLDTELWLKFFNKGHDPNDLNGVVKAEWFLLDVNTIS
ncbi:uncharacterized protein UTRI_02011 [Ustilago trichophora]|uniref:Uncharacterized protein n=1 Tax=Ustilago trichophora TaxID=86804 RepID=A0A5C3DY54_9BASI|nr:uncharacterized protein UTRI_02011 [Ustilago trichophora]